MCHEDHWDLSGSNQWILILTLDNSQGHIKEKNVIRKKHSSN